MLKVNALISSAIPALYLIRLSIYIYSKFFFEWAIKCYLHLIAKHLTFIVTIIIQCFVHLLSKGHFMTTTKFLLLNKQAKILKIFVLLTCSRILLLPLRMLSSLAVKRDFSQFVAPPTWKRSWAIIRKIKENNCHTARYRANYCF